MTRTALLSLAVCLSAPVWAQLPGKQDSFKFAVIGDTGTGGRAQYQVGARLAELQKSFPFHSVLMLGDNLYGGQKERDFKTKFEMPYAALLESGVKFYAILGNHDAPSQKTYKHFNMRGRDYYEFEPAHNVHFFGIDSNHLDGEQISWIEKQLSECKDDWKFAFFHHPIYSSAARHGSDMTLRGVLEPLFKKYGVAAVFAGHDHVYERFKPQNGITYFVVGGSSKLRAGNVRKSDLTAKSFDRDNSFAVFEIDKDQMHFRALSRTGQVIDEGVVPKRSGHQEKTTATEAASK